MLTEPGAVHWGLCRKHGSIWTPALILIGFPVLKSQACLHASSSVNQNLPQSRLALSKLGASGTNLKCVMTTGDISVTAVHWSENKLRANCSGPLTAPGVIFTGMAFSGAFSGSVLLWNEAYLSVKAQTNILRERVQLCKLLQRSMWHFFNLINQVCAVWVAALCRGKVRFL